MAISSDANPETNRFPGRTLGRRLFRENPLLGTMMGLCPALAVSYRVDNALVLGAAVFVILLLSAATFSLIGEHLPGRAHFTLELVVTSCLATVAELLLRAYAPGLASRLGIYVPLIAVNCLVLAATARGTRRTGFGVDILRATGDGIGFFVALLAVSIVRELLGSGTLTLFRVGSFDGILYVGGLDHHPVRLFGYSAGAFVVLGYLQALSIRFARRGRKEAAA